MQVFPWYDAHSGMRSWQETVTGLCINPILDEMESKNQELKTTAVAEVQSLTTFKDMVSRVSKTIHAQSQILKSWNTRLGNCSKSPVHKIDCSDLQLEMKNESSKIFASLNTLNAQSNSLPDLQRQQIIMRLEHARFIQNQFVLKFGTPK